MRRKWPWLAAMVLGWALVASPASSSEPPPADCPGGSACIQPSLSTQASAGQELAEQYAPIVYVQLQKESCDGREYWPIDVEMFLNAPGHVLRQDVGGRPVVVDEPGGSDLYGRGESFYLDFPGNPIRPGCTYENTWRERSPGYEAVAYAHIATEEGHEGIALQYWLFYYFNQWNNNHEGDWEMIQLNFDAATVEEALAEEPVSAGFSQHGGGERAEWGSDRLTIEEGRPVSFVAAGAGANMFGPHNYLGRAEEPGVGLGCDDATPPHLRVPLTARLMNPDPQSADDEYAWLTFEGRWGELSRLPSFRGPTGPNMKFAWDHPFSWFEERLRDHNFRVPAGRTAGPGAVNFFCDSLSFLSNRVLWVYYAWPWLLPVTLVGVVAGTAYGIRRTDFGVIPPPPLRKRRRTGQVLRTSLRLYRQHALTYLAVALLMIPAGLVASAVVALVTSNPPVENVLSVIDSPRALTLVFDAALGSVIFGVAYLVVLCGVTAALAEVHEGKTPSVGSALRKIWDRAGGLAWARLKAALILTLLYLSIVGIPWAIHRAVRWTFLEQAQLLDGHSASTAARRSGELVSGHWLETFVRVTALLVVGLMAAPLVAIPLLLFIAVPLALVNLVSSVIYFAMIPYVAIALALTYFDLEARQDEG